MTFGFYSEFDRKLSSRRLTGNDLLWKKISQAAGDHQRPRAARVLDWLAGNCGRSVGDGSGSDQGDGSGGREEWMRSRNCLDKYFAALQVDSASSTSFFILPIGS